MHKGRGREEVKPANNEAFAMAPGEGGSRRGRGAMADSGGLQWP